ncbi:MAG: F0F1 ATP synthase subunit gamma [Anaerolineales bacterium]
MQTLDSLKRRINSAEDLQSIVRTMKALAAVSIRQYEKAVESLVEYNRTTELSLHVVLTDRGQELLEEEKKPGGRVGAIIFGSDQGMCGQFNDVIADYALSNLIEMGISEDKWMLMSVGIRVDGRLQDAGYPVQKHLSLPGSVSGISSKVQTMVMTLDAWRLNRGVNTVYLFYNRPTSGATYRPTTVRLLPIDVERLRSMETKTWPSHILPTFTMDRQRLLRALIRQHLFVLSFRAFAESLASENAARLSAMQSAEQNIDDRLLLLNQEYHGLRQNSITSELLDIVSGFEVLTSG